MEAGDFVYPNTPLEAARLYVAAGYRVVPIAPGAKAPPIKAWQTAATDDLAVVELWWTGAYRYHGVGLLMGHRGIFAVDVDVSGGKVGAVTLAALEAAHGALPPTVEQRTGTGGRHLLFATPEGREVPHNSAGTRLGTDLDIRGIGGQILASPTLHPNGVPYVWVAGAAPWEREPADAPIWLLDLLAPREVAPREVAPWIGSSSSPFSSPVSASASSSPSVTSSDPSERPGDLFNRTTTWETLLVGDGWQRGQDGPEGEQRWTRPGKALRDGPSATVGYGSYDLLKVFTSSALGLEQDRTYDRWGYYVATRFEGDHSAAGRAHAIPREHADPADLILDGERRLLETSIWPYPPAAPVLAPMAILPLPEAHASWRPIDLAAALDAPPEVPTVLLRSDGRPLFYAGRSNMLYGESGQGKSWVALAAVAELLAAGETVVYVDLEDDAAPIVHRLELLGVERDAILTRFLYVQPDVKATALELDALDVLIAELGPALIVVDSLGEALALQEAKQNDDDAVSAWYRTFARRWSARGPCVLLIDHVPKDPARPRGWSIGSQRKKAALTGAMFEVDPITPFAIDHPGRLRLVCAKDRHGAWPMGQVAAEVVVDGTAEAVRLTFELPPLRDATGAVQRPTWLMERVSSLLFMRPDLAPMERTKAALAKAIGKRSADVGRAIDVLIEEGFVEAREERASRGRCIAHYSVRRFTEAADVVLDGREERGKTILMPFHPGWADMKQHENGLPALPTLFPEEHRRAADALPPLKGEERGPRPVRTIVNPFDTGAP